MEVAEARGALWFGPRAAIDGAPVGASWHPSEGPDALAALLARIGRAERVAGAIAGAADTGLLRGPSPVRAETRIARSDAGQLDPPGRRTDAVRECRRIARGEAYGAPGALPAPTEVKQCDRLDLAARAVRPGSFDVNRVTIDARYCVRSAWARVEGTTVPVPVGERMVVCSDCPDGEAAGVERMLVLVSEARENAAPLNLTGLLDTCGREATRSAGTAGLLDLVTAVGATAGTRGWLGEAAPERVWVEEARWTVLPRAIALERAAADDIATQRPGGDGR